MISIKKIANYIFNHAGFQAIVWIILIGALVLGTCTDVFVIFSNVFNWFHK